MTQDNEPPLIDITPSHPRYPNGAPRSYGRVHTGQMIFSLAVGLLGLAFTFYSRAELQLETLFTCAAFSGALTAWSLVILFRRFI